MINKYLQIFSSSSKIYFWKSKDLSEEIHLHQKIVKQFYSRKDLWLSITRTKT